MSNIKFTNIHKSFGTNKIINNFNLEGKEDEFLVLVGPGFGGRGIEGKIESIKYVRLNNIPFFG